MLCTAYLAFLIVVNWLLAQFLGGLTASILRHLFHLHWNPTILMVGWLILLAPWSWLMYNRVRTAELEAVKKNPPQE